MHFSPWLAGSGRGVRKRCGRGCGCDGYCITTYDGVQAGGGVFGGALPATQHIGFGVFFFTLGGTTAMCSSREQRLAKGLWMAARTQRAYFLLPFGNVTRRWEERVDAALRGRSPSTRATCVYTEWNIKSLRKAFVLAPAFPIIP
jgi:hypothetical protein